MVRFWANGCDIAPAQRGQIIQRVLVDGWSPTQAGAAFGVGERQVARWVAAYRRHGMASLRPAAAEPGARGLIQRLKAMLARLGHLGHDIAAEPARCIVLRRERPGERPLNGPGRRSHWY